LKAQNVHNVHIFIRKYNARCSQSHKNIIYLVNLNNE